MTVLSDLILMTYC